MSSCSLFTLVYFTEELLDPGNSRSFAPAPFHFSDSQARSVAAQSFQEFRFCHLSDIFLVLKIVKAHDKLFTFLNPATMCSHCYAPWYKSVIQLGFGLYGIHNLVPAALGSVYPVETSTSYNLYIHTYMCNLGLRPPCAQVFGN